MKDNFDLTELKSSEKKKLNSRTKGNTFERKVCDILNTRFSTKDFMRSPGSGAFATSHRLPAHLKFYGDLLTPQNFNFTIECKKGYNKEGIDSLLVSKSELWKFLEQAETDAQKANKRPLLIWQQDRSEILVFFEEDLIDKDLITYPFCTLSKDFIMMRLKNFLELPISFFS